MVIHQFANIRRQLQLSNTFWDDSTTHGLVDIVAADMRDGIVNDRAGRTIVNFSSYSYLGLDSDPRIIAGAHRGLDETATINSSISRMRIRLSLLEEAEQRLSLTFGAQAVTVSSCAAAAWATLPLLASGEFTDGHPPLVVFDKNAHFCLNAMKPLVADETELVTIDHNDIEALEQLCRKHSHVAYIADGVYSTGGGAPLDELHRLQDQYGLFLYFDEAHGISTLGRRGRGYVLGGYDGWRDRTLIIASLNKGFGASGGVIFFGPPGDDSRKPTLLRTSGPLMWSQRINTAGLGAIVASCDLHDDGTVDRLQIDLRERVRLFNSLVDTDLAGDGLPIRFVDIGREDTTVAVAKDMLDAGFYTSPVFFPIIRRGSAGLRLMLRADLEPNTIRRFADTLTASLAAHRDREELPA
ncbi:aminotransferase class I/II-fold pyridoxal phosphate-dependent enzyme [Nocardia arthritidis]|uniref:8-amino-7-oxononanoate synthase n=1 Tax=Nocardia arthritidis TaxID=228602 RepID=A0A6G9YQH2_9NOCA|nr:aminotransferase class I/II-fold pyridoxal phosphate-dependent enzyme [Nocardia arthritidis]QIS15549.1 aminotransferase class I/II-fold pyridoxal phosphate-dependent enzyme [Nocardia arthritidis]